MACNLHDMPPAVFYEADIAEMGRSRDLWLDGALLVSPPDRPIVDPVLVVTVIDTALASSGWNGFLQAELTSIGPAQLTTPLSWPKRRNIYIVAAPVGLI
jgi:hypothetical protein